MSARVGSRTVSAMKWLLTYPEDGPSVAFYEQWVRAAGAQPVLVAHAYTHPGDLTDLAALLLAGGGDVDPALYGAAPHPRTGGISPARDALEQRLIQEFLALGRPVFGICRGVQILNVTLGGGLVQHVPDVVRPDLECHRQQKGYDSRHSVTADPSTALGRALQEAGESNSAHHQAVDPARLGRGVHIAIRSGAGLVEGIEAPGCSAVQWHPERLPLDHPASVTLRAHWAAIARG